MRADAAARGAPRGLAAGRLARRGSRSAWCGRAARSSGTTASARSRSPCWRRSRERPASRSTACRKARRRRRPPRRRAGMRLVDLTARIADFSDTAALGSLLDLVITIDTSVAHLAGAMGVAGLGAGRARAGLALPPRARGQSLVSDHAAVPPGARRRLDWCDRAGFRGTRAPREPGKARDRPHPPQAHRSMRRMAASAASASRRTCGSSCPTCPSGGTPGGMTTPCTCPICWRVIFGSVQNGLFAVPWFSPAQCAGVPFLADLNVAYYSLPQWATFAVGPAGAVRLTFVALRRARGSGLLRSAARALRGLAVGGGDGGGAFPVQRILHLPHDRGPSHLPPYHARALAGLGVASPPRRSHAAMLGRRCAGG